MLHEIISHIFNESENLWVMSICILVPLTILIFCWKNLNLPLVQAIPGLCTGVGIVFTFGIIYHALGINEGLFQNNEIASLKQVVKSLSYKFSCSLIGVVFSILWSLVIKSIISFRESQANLKKEWLQRKPEEILWSLEQNTIKTFGAQERILAVVETFDEKARQDLRSTLNDLKTALTNSMASLGKDALESAMVHIVKANTAFMEKAEVLLDNNQKAFGEVLTTSSETLEQTLEKLKEIGDSLQAEIAVTRKGAQEGAETVAKGFESGAGTIKAGFEEVAESVGQKFDHLLLQLANLDQQLQQQTQQILENNLEKVEKAFGRLEEIQSNSINRLEASAEQFNKSIHSFEQLQDHQHGVLGRVQAQIDLLKQLQENAEAQLNEWDDQVDKMVEVRNRVADIAIAITELQDIKDLLAQITSRN